MQKDKYYTKFGVALGLLFIIGFLYLRLLVERLPTLIFTDFTIFTLLFYTMIILFNLWHTGFGEIILNYFAYQGNLKPSKLRLKIKKIISFFMQPLLLVYNTFIKDRKYAEWLSVYITAGTRKIFLKYRLITIILDLLPRFIIVLALFFDITIGVFYYFYRSLALYLIPLLYVLLLHMTQQVNFKYLKLYNKYFSFTWVFTLNFDTLIRCLTKRLFFTYNPQTPKEQRDKKTFNSVLNLYTATIFQSILLNAKEDYILIFFNRLIYFIFALEWWYILFHILIELPPISWHFLSNCFIHLLYILF